MKRLHNISHNGESQNTPPPASQGCHGYDDQEKEKQDRSLVQGEKVDDKKHNNTTCPYNMILTKKFKPITGNSNDRRNKKSRFESCPICLKAFPKHTIERHAACCTGPPCDDKYHDPEPSNPIPPQCNDTSETNGERNGGVQSSLEDDISIVDRVEVIHKWKCILNNDTGRQPTEHKYLQSSSNQPLPGLFIFEEFISLQEEEDIISMLDGRDLHADTFLPWKPSKFNGKHCGKRWGVHCSLRDRKVYPQDNPLPPLLLNLIDRISQLQIMKGCVPNEANAIDYHKKNGDYLKNHVDDRQLSKEPIANLSLAGDCFMTFRLERHTAPQHFPKERKVLLKRRTLQILTSNARYDYSHGIQNEHLLSDRRISITMRESPLSM